MPRSIVATVDKIVTTVDKIVAKEVPWSIVATVDKIIFTGDKIVAKEVPWSIVATVDKIIFTGDKIVAKEVQQPTASKALSFGLQSLKQRTHGNSWCLSNYCGLAHKTVPIQSNFNRGKWLCRSRDSKNTFVLVLSIKASAKCLFREKGLSAATMPTELDSSSFETKSSLYWL